MRKDNRQQAEPKGVYRVKNWAQYNKGLIARGDVTMWVEESLLVPPAKAQSPKRGHPLVYTDALIQGLLGLKQVFHLPLRALQGFAQSLRTLAFPTLPVPNYTTLSRRAQNLNVVLPASNNGEPLHLAVDSTGLKLYGVCASQERYSHVVLMRTPTQTQYEDLGDGSASRRHSTGYVWIALNWTAVTSWSCHRSFVA